MTFKPWDERTKRSEQFQSLKAHLNQQLSKLPTAVAFGFLRPPFPVSAQRAALLYPEDRSGGDVQFLAKNLGTFLEAARKRPKSPASAPLFWQASPKSLFKWIATKS